MTVIPSHHDQNKLDKPTLSGTATVIFKIDIDLGDLPTQGKLKLFLEDGTLSVIAEISLRDNILEVNKRTTIEAEIADLSLNAGLYSFLFVITSPNENRRYIRASGVCQFSVIREGVISWAPFLIKAN